MSKELEDKIKNMDTLTQSQIDRMNKNIEIQDNLFIFLGNQIEKVTNENSLKRQLLEDIKGRMNREGFDSIPWMVILKLLEIYSKEENEIAITILNMIKEVQIKNSENDSVDKIIETIQKEKGDGIGDMSKEDMQRFKSLFEFMNSVKDSEFNENEKK